MSLEFLKKNAQTLGEFARETSVRAAQNPADFWLQAAARIQQQAALDATQALRIANAKLAAE